MQTREQRNQARLLKKAQEYVDKRTAGIKLLEEADEALRFLIAHAKIGQVWELPTGAKVELVNNFANGNEYWHSVKAKILDLKPVKKGKR